MPLKSYGVLVGRPAERRREGGTDSPHYQIRIDAAGTQTTALPPLALNAGASLEIELGTGAKPGNKGGSITLLDAAGLKVAGVAYTADQARREGWTLTF